VYGSRVTADGLHFGDCDVVEQLSSGPVTDLYRGLQQPVGRPVLIKALSASILPSSPFASSLEREARLLARLDHPNIVTLYGFQQQHDRMWLVLQAIDGWSLQEALQRVPRWPPLAAAALALLTARGLAHAHAHGIVHRDVSPANIHVARNGNVTLGGFNVATDERMPSLPELLDGATSIDTSYLSPEQVLGERTDPRSDIFSLGAVLFRLLTGQVPFPESAAGGKHRLSQEAAPPVTRYATAVPSALERVVQRCLRRLPPERFESAGALAVALEQLLGELTPLSAEQLVSSVVTGVALPTREGAASRRAEAAKPKPGLGRALGGLAWIGAATVAGTLGLYAAALHRGVELDAPSTSQALPLVPNQAGQLRVLAEPWAEVFVDGEHVETTPFSHPIALRAGTHYVKLEHPEAPTEERTIELSAGETVLLDVVMKVRRPRPVPQQQLAEAAPDAGAPDAGAPRPSP
jgi:hypothetical protein